MTHPSTIPGLVYREQATVPSIAFPSQGPTSHSIGEVGPGCQCGPIWAVQVYPAVTGRSRVWNSYLLKYTEAGRPRHTHGQWGAVGCSLFPTHWPQGLRPDPDDLQHLGWDTGMCQGREIGTFWISIFL